MLLILPTVLTPKFGVRSLNSLPTVCSLDGPQFVFSTVQAKWVQSILRFRLKHTDWSSVIGCTPITLFELFYCTNWPNCTITLSTVSLKKFENYLMFSIHSNLQIWFAYLDIHCLQLRMDFGSFSKIFLAVLKIFQLSKQPQNLQI